MSDKQELEQKACTRASGPVGGELIDDLKDYQADCKRYGQLYGEEVVGRAIIALQHQQDTISRKEAANMIAKRLPVDMLKPYDTDSFSSMLSAVAYLKQHQQYGVCISRECAVRSSHRAKDAGHANDFYEIDEALSREGRDE